MSDAYLQIDNLKTHFPVEKGVLIRRVEATVKAVDGVSLRLAKGLSRKERRHSCPSIARTKTKGTGMSPLLWLTHS